MWENLNNQYWGNKDCKIYQGDVLSVLRSFPDEFVDCCITSPPYWALRDYQLEPVKWDDGYYSLGLEPTFELYLKHLLQIFDEIKRILKPTGTVWVNLGDTYSGSKIGKTDKKVADYVKESQNNLIKNCKEVLAKSLCLIPQRFAIGMVDRGWILRNQIIWYKRNCMPSSVKDRFTIDYEPIFFFVKSKKYWFEQQYEPHTRLWDENIGGSMGGGNKEHKIYGEIRKPWKNPSLPNPLGRNRRCVWDITTKPFKGSHFAVFPETLVEPMIRSGCPEFICKKCGKAREKIYKNTYLRRDELSKNDPDYRPNTTSTRFNRFDNTNKTEMDFKWKRKQTQPIGYTDCGCNAGWTSGIVLDPFAGAFTTGIVAQKLYRKFIGIELSKVYIDTIGIPRLEKTQEEVKTLFIV